VFDVFERHKHSAVPAAESHEVSSESLIEGSGSLLADNVEYKFCKVG